eukprot:104692-Rhodomonas_salina.2
MATPTKSCPSTRYSSGEPHAAQVETQVPSASASEHHASTSQRRLMCRKDETGPAKTAEKKGATQLSPAICIVSSGTGPRVSARGGGGGGGGGGG